jgi:CRP-like cAMP-binding protein
VYKPGKKEISRHMEEMETGVNSTNEKNRLMLKEFSAEDDNSAHAELLHEKKAVRVIKKKEIIYKEGDVASCLFFINSGKVKTLRTNADGKEIITEILKKDDFFGYTSLFDDKGRRETAIAIEDSELVCVTREDFLKILSASDLVGMKFIRFMANTLDEAEKRLLKLAYDSARKRVAEALLFVFRKSGIEENKFETVSRDTISSIAGVAPESVSRNLTDFKEEGLIESEGGTIKICDYNMLEKIKY